MDPSRNGGFGPAESAPREVYAERRKRLLERIGDGVAVVPAAPELLRSRDTEVRFRQSSDLFYLTGFPEPEAVAVITPHDAEHRLTLFVRRRDPEREVWVGARLGVEAAGEAVGASAVYGIDELPTKLPDLLKSAERVFYPIGLHPALDLQVTEAISNARRGRQRAGRGPTGATDLEAVTADLRLIKDVHEIERMRIAGRISAAAHEAAMRICGPGRGEWELQAELEARMRALGAEGPAFPSIVASGRNATTLHYVENSRRIEDGELVLIDAGAEWGMYAADISRTFPANGRFTEPQRALYDVVLAAETAAIEATRPGERIDSVHQAAVRVLAQGLIDLGILQGVGLDEALEKGAFKRYFMHQTSHWLGLDVHDVGQYAEGETAVTLKPGMALTIEPGLYLPAADDVPAPYRGVGIRIEDDVVVTETGNEILTRDVPVDPVAVEQLVGRAGG